MEVGPPGGPTETPAGPVEDVPADPEDEAAETRPPPDTQVCRGADGRREDPVEVAAEAVRPVGRYALPTPGHRRHETGRPHKGARAADTTVPEGGPSVTEAARGEGPDATPPPGLRPGRAGPLVDIPVPQPRGVLAGPEAPDVVEAPRPGTVGDARDAPVGHHAPADVGHEGPVSPAPPGLTLPGVSPGPDGETGRPPPHVEGPTRGHGVAAALDRSEDKARVHATRVCRGVDTSPVDRDPVGRPPPVEVDAVGRGHAATGADEGLLSEARVGHRVSPSGGWRRETGGRGPRRSL